MTMQQLRSLAMALLAIQVAAQTTTNPAGTFVFSVDLLQGETGYFNVEGHDGVQPALTMVR